MDKPEVIERYADNGAHSHWELVDGNTGEMLWSEDEAADMGHNLQQAKVAIPGCTGEKHALCDQHVEIGCASCPLARTATVG